MPVNHGRMVKKEMEFEAAEMKFLRIIQGYSLLDQKRYQDIKRKLKTNSLHEKIQKIRDGAYTVN